MIDTTKSKRKGKGCNTFTDQRIKLMLQILQTPQLVGNLKVTQQLPESGELVMSTKMVICPKLKAKNVSKRMLKAKKVELS